MAKFFPLGARQLSVSYSTLGLKGERTRDSYRNDDEEIDVEESKGRDVNKL